MDQTSANQSLPWVVVGAGVAGLAAATEIITQNPLTDVLVLEHAKRPGGLVETERTSSGLVIEHGPDSLLTYKPEGVDVCQSLGIDGNFVEISSKRRAFIVHGGKLLPLPEGLASMTLSSAVHLLGSPLFSLRGKLRLTLEPFVARTREQSDESVRSFMQRRFGSEFVDRMVEPLIGGIHGAGTEDLSRNATLPKLRALEARYGSIALGLLRRRNGIDAATDLPPVVSFRDGMQTLTDAMARRLGDKLKLGVGVKSIKRGADGRFELHLSGGGQVYARGVVLAVPAHAGARLVSDLDTDLAAMLAAFDYSPMHWVTFAWRSEDIAHPMNGTGLVVGRGEHRATSACTWSSKKWPGRAPEGTILMRSFVAADDASDAELVELARNDLRDLMGIEASPLFTQTRRQRKALPRYTVGHLERVNRVRTAAAGMGAFALAGNTYDGLSIPDCIRSGKAAARSLMQPELAEDYQPSSMTAMPVATIRVPAAPSP